MKLHNLLNTVRTFQELSQQPFSDTPNIGTIEEGRLRYRLMKEETKEYFKAVYDKDKVEVLDALVDQMYVLLGTINQHGMQSVFLEAFKLVHENNMTKLINGKIVKNKDGKILKPKNFKPVDLTNLIS